MSSQRAKKLENTCPVCDTDLIDSSRLEQAKKELDKALSRGIRDSTRQQRDEYRGLLKGLKVKHKSEVRDLRKASAEQQTALRDKQVAAAKKEKAAYKVALTKLKRNNQEQLRSLRDTYDRENLRLQKEQESSFNLQLQEIIRNYGNLATDHQKEQERLKKIHDENDSLLRKRDSEIANLRIELAKSSSKLEVKELALKLHERDDTIERLNSRILELEGRIVSPPRPPVTKEPQKIMSDEEQREKLKEYMRAIIEITRSQQAEKKKSDHMQGMEGEKPDIPESKGDRKLGWFF
jgi:hypothetical protein